MDEGRSTTTRSRSITVNAITRLVLVETLGGIARPTKQFLHACSPIKKWRAPHGPEYGAASATNISKQARIGGTNWVKSDEHRDAGDGAPAGCCAAEASFIQGSVLLTYSKLSERSSAAALRRKVAEPSGFAGLELGDMGYETLPAPVPRALHVLAHARVPLY